MALELRPASAGKTPGAEGAVNLFPYSDGAGRKLFPGRGRTPRNVPIIRRGHCGFSKSARTMIEKVDGANGIKCTWLYLSSLVMPESGGPRTVNSSILWGLANEDQVAPCWDWFHETHIACRLADAS